MILKEKYIKNQQLSIHVYEHMCMCVSMHVCFSCVCVCVYVALTFLLTSLAQIKCKMSFLL